MVLLSYIFVNMDRLSVITGRSQMVIRLFLNYMISFALPIGTIVQPFLHPVVKRFFLLVVGLRCIVSVVFGRFFPLVNTEEGKCYIVNRFVPDLGYYPPAKLVIKYLSRHYTYRKMGEGMYHVVFGKGGVKYNQLPDGSRVGGLTINSTFSEWLVDRCAKKGYPCNVRWLQEEIISTRREDLSNELKTRSATCEHNGLTALTSVTTIFVLFSDLNSAQCRTAMSCFCDLQYNRLFLRHCPQSFVVHQLGFLRQAGTGAYFLKQFVGAASVAAGLPGVGEVLKFFGVWEECVNALVRSGIAVEVGENVIERVSASFDLNLTRYKLFDRDAVGASNRSSSLVNLERSGIKFTPRAAKLFVIHGAEAPWLDLASVWLSIENISLMASILPIRLTVYKVMLLEDFLSKEGCKATPYTLVTFARSLVYC